MSENDQINEQAAKQTTGAGEHRPGPREREMMARQSGNGSQKEYGKNPNLPAEDTETRLMKVFINQSADTYLALFDAMRNNAPVWRSGFNVHAFFFGLAWLLYRKLYIEGVVLFLLILIPSLLFPKLMLPVLFLVMVLLGLGASRYYIDYAQRKIHMIQARLPEPFQQEDAVRRAGGTSKTGLFVGVMLFTIIVLLASTAIFMQFYDTERATPANKAVHQLATLPDCNDPNVKELNRARAHTVLGGSPDAEIDIKLGIGEQIAGQANQKRTCKTIILADGNSRTIYFDLYWNSDNTLGLRWRPAPR